LKICQQIEMMGFLSNIVVRLNGSSCSLNFAMLPKDDEKKDARKSAKKNKDLVNKSGGKAKKKKWSKDTHSLTVISERLKISSSLARAAFQKLLSKGLIKLVSKHRAHVTYTRNTKGGDAPAT
ncbi:hypothetical protein EI555_017984, partial [Monodon monoceros]